MRRNGFSSIQNLDELVNAGFSDEQARAILNMMSQDSATKEDLEHSTTELRREIAEVKREITEVKRAIEIVRADLKRDIKELDKKIEDISAGLKKDMAIIMGSYSVLILGALVTLAKFGLLTPTVPTP